MPIDPVGALGATRETLNRHGRKMDEIVTFLNEDVDVAGAEAAQAAAEAAQAAAETAETAAELAETNAETAEAAAEAALAAFVLTARSKEFDLDNGAGVTLDDVIIKNTLGIEILAARIVYTDATSGTVAAGKAQIGTSVDGEQIVAETAYQNAKAVGTETALVIVEGTVAAGTPVIVRHTGVAATAAGKAYIEIEYQIVTP